MIPKDSRRVDGRKSRQEVYGSIALSALPAPRGVRFVDDILSLNFDSIAECLSWARHLRAADVRVETRGGRRYFVQYNVIKWLGWHVSLSAHEDLRPVNEVDDSLSTPEETVYAPCRPIGCDAGSHLPGCVYAPADEEAGA